MKKTIYFMALMAFGFTMHSQITKGRSMLGMRFNYSQSGNTEAYPDNNGAYSNYIISNSHFSPGISYGYMLSDHLMLGFTANYLQSKSERVIPDNSVSGSENKSEQKSYNAGLLARYYQRIKTSKFYIFGQLTATYGNGSRTEKYSNFDPSGISVSSIRSSVNTSNVSISPGVLYMLNRNIGLETYLGVIGFQHSNEKSYNDKDILVRSTSSNSFDSNILFQFSSLSIGVNFYFGGKRA